MSWSERSVQYHKHQTDCAIHHAYTRLASDTPTLTKFGELLHCVRNRAPHFLDAPIVNGHHPGVDALVNLARYESAHIRPLTSWQGTSSTWRKAVSSLANHLVCSYPLPLFLTAAWYSNEDKDLDEKRIWFISHARGMRFRSLNLPIEMTRKMEDIFLASHDHFGIHYALRRAELLALGMPAQFLNAILNTRFATDLRNGEFWRSVWHFLVVNAPTLPPSETAPILDFLQAIRHDRTTTETPDGLMELGPPQPRFSIKGRTVPSILRLMRDWHRSLASGGSGFGWAPSAMQPLLLEESGEDASTPPRQWRLIELTNSAQLRAEGAALHHCVASYADRCRRGTSRIWSLRYFRDEKIHHTMTIEVDPHKRTIVQARAFANRMPSGKPLRLLRDWAHRERLQLAI